MKFDQTNEHVVTKLQDLQPNDKIKGMDNNKNLVNNCEIVSVSKIGIGTVYGNYTRDHYILSDDNENSGDLTQHGDGELSPEGKQTFVYQMLSSCPLNVDESGKKVRHFSAMFIAHCVCRCG